MTAPTRRKRTVHVEPKLVLTEAQFQDRVMDAAKTLGWRIVHIRPLWQRDGKMVTPYTGHKGLPDLILARRGTVLLIELKSDAGQASLDQLAWLEQAGKNGYLFRPADWPQVLQVLQSR